jgi:hypothetical protein
MVRGSEFRQELGILLFTTASRQALGPTQAPIQWVPWALFVVEEQPGREANHYPPSNVEVKNAWSYTFTPPIRLHGVMLSYRKAQGQLKEESFCLENVKIVEAVKVVYI